MLEHKFITKGFKDKNEIDDWLFSFKKDKVSSEYEYKVIGYVVYNDEIVITLEVYELC